MVGTDQTAIAMGSVERQLREAPGTSVGRYRGYAVGDRAPLVGVRDQRCIGQVKFRHIAFAGVGVDGRCVGDLGWVSNAAACKSVQVSRPAISRRTPLGCTDSFPSLDPKTWTRQGRWPEVLWSAPKASRMVRSSSESCPI